MKTHRFEMLSCRLTLAARGYADLEMSIAPVGTPSSKAMLATTVFGNDDETNRIVSETYGYRREKIARKDLNFATARGAGYWLAARTLKPAT